MSKRAADMPSPRPSVATAAAEPAGPTADKRGLECRWCGCKHFEVLYTRATWGSRLMRRRQCRHCGKRMTTWEQASHK